jgi:hypothetical protein
MPKRFEYIVETPYIKVDGNSITFTIQNGPIKENGVNGCQVDDMIIVATTIIRKLNGEFPCRENSIAIGRLEEATMWLEKRKADRESRGVEGTNKA